MVSYVRGRTLDFFKTVVYNMILIIIAMDIFFIIPNWAPDEFRTHSLVHYVYSRIF